MTQQLPPSGAAPAVVPLRQRLPPEVRVLQILDAALVEFSERGFAAARMDDIARRCGLSKGGLYAHFAGKEEVFEALLTRSLAPPDFGQMPVLGYGIRPLAQWVVDKLYDSPEPPSPPKRAAHYLWAVLIARIYEVFPLVCPLCGGHMRIIAFITHSADIRHILDHIGVESEPPRITPARGPPLWEEPNAQAGEGSQIEPDWDLAPQPAPDYEVNQRISW